MSETPNEMVGAGIPGRLLQRLNLYAYATKQSRSQIIRTALFDYMESRGIDPAKLAKDIANHHKDEYLRLKYKEVHPTDLGKYVITLKTKLTAKRLPSDIIDKICKEILNEKNKH